MEIKQLEYFRAIVDEGTISVQFLPPHPGFRAVW